MKLASILLIVITARAAAYSRHSLEKLASGKPAPAPAPAPGPASGPAPGPAAAALKALQVTFEIKNYNYYDLTKETCPKSREVETIPKPSPPKAKGNKGTDFGLPGLNKAINSMGDHIDRLASGGTSKSGKPPPPPWMEDETGKKAPPPDMPEGPDVDSVDVSMKTEEPPWMEDGGANAKPPPPSTAEMAEEADVDVDTDVDTEQLPWMATRDAAKKEKESPFVKGQSLLATEADRVCVMEHSSLAAIHAKSDTCKTVMDVFRSAMTEVVKDVVKCMANMPPPMVTAPAAALAMSPATAFLQSIQPAAPAPAAPSDGKPDAAVHVAFSPGKEVGSGRSVIVEITLTDTPGNGLDDVALTRILIERALKLGLLKREFKAALAIVTGIWPKLGKIKAKAAAVEAWDVAKCEGHVRGIVQQFSHHYTREQVPMAMFNECTNFMTRISFSHDHVLDPADTLMCRKTTATFAKHWNFGEKAKPEDFQQMCVRSCEAKFGKDAPQCHVTHGDELLGQPLL